MFGKQKHRHNNEPLYINPLSQHRRNLKTCEVCEKPAFMYCRHCQKAFYCCRRHLDDDRDAVHGQLCDHVRNLYSTIVPHNMADRSRLIVAQAIIKNEISDLCVDLARDAISVGQHEVASYRVKMARKYCSRDPEHEPKFMAVLATEMENLVAQNKMGSASTTLAGMTFMFNRRQNVPDDIKIILYRSEGIYHMASGNTSEAIDCFSNMVYCGAMHNKDPESCDCAEGMFFLGQAFLKKGSYDIAWSYYVHAASIWDSIFSRMFDGMKSRNEFRKVVDLTHSNQMVDAFPQYGRLKAVRSIRKIITDNDTHDLASNGVDGGKQALCGMYRSLATAYLLDRQWTKAGKLAKMALNKVPNDKQAQAVLKQARKVFWGGGRNTGVRQLTEKEMEQWPSNVASGDLTPVGKCSEVNIVQTRSFMQFKDDMLSTNETDQQHLKDATGFAFQEPLLKPGLSGLNLVHRGPPSSAPDTFRESRRTSNDRSSTASSRAFRKRLEDVENIGGDLTEPQSRRESSRMSRRESRPVTQLPELYIHPGKASSSRRSSRDKEDQSKSSL